MELLLGIPLGIGASVIAWWLVTRRIAPSIEISQKISKQPHASAASGFSYRVKVLNTRQKRKGRFLIDVMWMANLRLPGYDTSRVTNTLNVPVPLSTDGDLVLKKSKAMGIRIDLIPDNYLRRFPEDLQQRIRSGEAVLEDLLALQADASLRVVVTATDAYSGVRGAAISPDYREEDIVLAPFSTMDCGLLTPKNKK